MIRFFRSEEHVHTWSAQTEVPIGEIVATANLWELSRRWYEGRLLPDWKPRPRDQAQQLLSEAGFAGPFWLLPEG